MDEEHDTLNEWELLGKMDVEERSSDKEDQTKQRRKPLAIRIRCIWLIDDDAVLDRVTNDGGA